MAGPLGPSTIVGSAAFNMFVILAICITAIPASVKVGTLWATHHTLDCSLAPLCTISFVFFSYHDPNPNDLNERT